MSKQIIRLTENDLHKIIAQSVNRILKEDFSDDYNNAMDKHISKGGLWGFEAKNGDGDWEYGNIVYNPNNNTMSCMNVSIDVDSDLSVDENLQALYDKIMESGYSND